MRLIPLLAAYPLISGARGGLTTPLMVATDGRHHSQHHHALLVQTRRVAQTISQQNMSRRTAKAGKNS
jgi:hypothetical protein